MQGSRELSLKMRCEGQKKEKPNPPFMHSTYKSYRRERCIISFAHYLPRDRDRKSDVTFFMENKRQIWAIDIVRYTPRISPPKTPHFHSLQCFDSSSSSLSLETKFFKPLSTSSSAEG